MTTNHSVFDPELFLQTEVDEASSTEYIPFPEGDWPAYIKELKCRLVDGKDGGESRPVMDVIYGCEAPEVLETMGRTEAVPIRQSHWLEITPTGALDMGKGKNVSLGRLREAIGQNEAGKAWNPLSMVGCPVVVTVTHSASGRADGQVYANVTAVAAS